VDGGPGKVDVGDAQGVRVILALDTGELAEVQVAKVGGILSVALDGDVGPPRTTRRGVQVLVVAPTPKRP
jgi:hypothetical protein